MVIEVHQAFTEQNFGASHCYIYPNEKQQRSTNFVYCNQFAGKEHLKTACFDGT